jgi:1,4-dihydroxy-2-naphthoyl-CoA hydrolase
MKHNYRIRLSDTDAAGRIYFASACRIAHESFEQFMEAIGFDLNAMINEMHFGLPVVHVDADYRASLNLGTAITIETTVKSLGNKSVVFEHVLATDSGEPAIVITITHAVVSKKTSRAVVMPANLRKALSNAN